MKLWTSALLLLLVTSIPLALAEDTSTKNASTDEKNLDNSTTLAKSFSDDPEEVSANMRPQKSDEEEDPTRPCNDPLDEKNVLGFREGAILDDKGHVLSRFESNIGYSDVNNDFKITGIHDESGNLIAEIKHHYNYISLYGPNGEWFHEFDLRNYNEISEINAHTKGFVSPWNISYTRSGDIFLRDDEHGIVDSFNPRIEKLASQNLGVNGFSSVYNSGIDQYNNHGYRTALKPRIETIHYDSKGKYIPSPLSKGY